MTRKILIVDDEQAIIDMFSKYLSLVYTDIDLEIDEANDGVTAFNMVMTNDYLVLILDITMPGMDGLTLLKSLREHKKSTNVIIVTGHAELEMVMEAMDQGAFNFFTKPVEMTELKRSLDKLLAKDTEKADFAKTFSYMLESSAKFKVPSETIYSEPLKDMIAHSMSIQGYDFNDIESLSYAFIETFFNAVEHGNKRNKSKFVEVDFTIDKTAARVEVKDEGEGFDESTIPVNFDPKDLDFKFGRGIYLMKCNTDELSFSEGGRKVTLVKNFR